MPELSASQELKLRMLSEGVFITRQTREWLAEQLGNTRSQTLSSADYASTSGIILKLNDDVWVNAPYEDYNPNFVRGASIRLDVSGDSLIITSDRLESSARYCLQAAYHFSNESARFPEPLVVTHADRVRLSPVSGCSMSCQFCNIPFEVPSSDYALHPVQTCIEALAMAVNDPVQPARHILVSGGTPKLTDVESHRELYRRILGAFPDIPVDIMMVPVPGILDVAELKRQGVNELSVNLEIFNEGRAWQLARQKYSYGRDYYLDFIEAAVEELGLGRVRSMLLVGLEDMESTLEGVEALARRGATPVLSPFRPDPATPLKDMKPPSYELMRETYSRAQEIAVGYGVLLGPSCPPCTHNTLSFATNESGKVNYIYDQPNLL
jgi:hypothetical protein